MNIQPLKCASCYGNVSKIDNIRQNEYIGIYFTCEYCGAMNVIDTLPETTRKRYETIVKEPIIGVTTKEKISSWENDIKKQISMASSVIGKISDSDLNADDAFSFKYREPSGYFKVTSWTVASKKEDYLRLLACPMVINDLTENYYPKIEGDVYIIRHETIDNFATSFLSQMIEKDLKTIVINNWNRLVKSCNEKVEKYMEISNAKKSSIGIDPYKWQIRNEIIEYMLGLLHSARRKGINIEIFHENQANIVKNFSFGAKRTLETEIPNILIYHATKIVIMDNASEIVMMEQ